MAFVKEFKEDYFSGWLGHHLGNHKFGKGCVPMKSSITVNFTLFGNVTPVNDPSDWALM